jgi:hypothetical protein
MGNDMSWEQKCRISALRAACASPLDMYMSTTDEEVTKRIVRRAETFRIALMGDGALDYVPDDDEGPDVRTFTHTCIRCTKAIRLVREKNQAERWEDVDGRELCSPAGIIMHTPVEPIGTHCPGCGSSRKDKFGMVPGMIGTRSTVIPCTNSWHREL